MDRGDEFPVPFSHLFIAVPELLWEDLFIQYLHRKGYINNRGLESLAQLKKAQGDLERIRKRMKGKSAFGRILAIAPEIISRRMIGVLETFGIINKLDATYLKVYMGILERAGKGGSPSTIAQVLLRARKIFGLGFADDMLAYLVNAEMITKNEATIVRGQMLGGKVAVETLKNALRAKNITEMLAMMGSGLIDKRTIDALRMAGWINNTTANALLTAMSYGSSQWTIFQGSKRAEGLAARMAYLVSGSFSPELVEFFTAIKKLTPEQAILLEIASKLSTEYNRKLMEDFTNRRFRVTPGEAPIVSFARSSKETDDALLRLLAEAADNSRREAARLASSGKAVRGAEYALRARALHQAMRQVWEGTGYLTIFGESKVANAAVSASELLQAKYSKHLPEFAKDMLEFQARSGIDSYISRRENTLPLSRRVYGNMDVWTKRVDKTISLALLQGKSAQEIADDVRSMINPKVMGGVKYSAMRLGRTELANAFHFTTIRHTREMPWVRGYKWNKSSSHRHGDICDNYAEDDHDGLGPGVFKKANVPGKPHPQCLCYVTVVGMTEDEFVKGYKAGRFNAYMSSRVKDDGIKARMMEGMIDKVAGSAGRIAGQVALSQASSLANRMVYSGGQKSVLFNRAENMAEGNTRDLGKKSSRFFAPTIQVSAHQDKPLENAKWHREHDPRFGENAERFANLEKEEKSHDKYRLFRKAKNEHIISFEEEGYISILPTDVDAQSLPSLASTMYGTNAYRTINRVARQSYGDLEKYDEYFGETDEAFDILQKMPRGAKDIALWDRLEEVVQKIQTSVFLDEEDEGDVPQTELDDGLYFNRLLNSFRDFDMSKYTKHSDILRRLDERMQPTNRDRFNYRITGEEWFGLEPGEELTKDHIGLNFTDNGFASMEGVKRYYAGVNSEELGLDVRNRSYRVKILVPDGTMATRINDLEYEILSSRGSNFQVLDVLDEKEGSIFKKTVYAIIQSQEELPDWKKKAAEETTDFWDDLIMDF